MSRHHRGLVLLTAGLIAVATACGSDADSETSEPVSTESGSTDVASTDAGVDADVSEPATGGVELVSVDDAAATIADPPPELVVLDVRTPDEFDAGHIDGATMLDFYEPDFAARLAELDRDVPYVIYCRSGNRSGQTAALMAGLEFRSVDDIDGGIVAWQSAGLPVTQS
jgi:rhodanese-related sulfurtransferase